MILGVENLAHSYGERTLFTNVNFNIEAGDKIGIIGVNGTGKSTLLRHLAKLDGGKEGKVFTNGACVIEYLPQEPDYNPAMTVLEQIFQGNSPLMLLLKRYEKALAEITEAPSDKKALAKYMALQQEMDTQNAWQLESEAKSVLTKLGITNFDQPMGELSGGQRKRVALAGVLIRPSDLLLLDEPTNHLDNDTVAWLETVLGQRKGALVMVTHDRYFFDRVINKTLELDNGTAYIYHANYSGFLAKREERRELESNAARKLQNIYRRELAWIKRGAEARRTKKKDRVENFYELQKEVQQEAPVENLEMTTGGASRLGKTIIELKHVSLTYNNISYIKDFTYTVLRRDRVGFVGPNGCGKTSLMDMIAGRLPTDPETIKIGQTVKIGYFTQHSEFSKSNLKVLEYIREVGDYVTGEGNVQISATQMLERFLFPPELQWMPVAKLSGGEQRRLQLLRVLMGAPNVLILDEPTNDLDIPTLSVLEDYLDHFAGAVLVVSHDRYFLDRISDKIFAFMGQGELQQFIGGYSAYAEAVSKNKKQEVLTTEKAKTPSTTKTKAETKNSATRKLTYSERLELASLEKEINTGEKQLQILAQEMNNCGNDFVKLGEITKNQQELQAKLDKNMDRWAMLSEIAENEEK
jgi:ATP-binding cassette subfamily F protein uup